MPSGANLQGEDLLGPGALESHALGRRDQTPRQRRPGQPWRLDAHHARFAGAIHREREERNTAPDYLDWYLSIDAAEEDFYFDAYSDAPGTVTVADGGRSLTVVMTMSGASGSLP